jgi:peptidoglycan/LPS O-acetylase OafA/YrhL
MKSSNLDILRAIAVGCVFLSHLVEATTPFRIGSLGRFGVILFFVHTSLVLMMSLGRLSRDASGTALLKVFWTRRFFRIYPLSVVAVLVVWLLRIPPYPHASYMAPSAATVVANLSLSQNLFYRPNLLAPLWSLPLEVQMYALLPFAYLGIRRFGVRSVPWIAAGGVTAALLMPHISGRLDVFSYAPCFGGGLIAYSLWGHAKRRLPSWSWPAALIAAMLCYGPFDNVDLSHKLARAWVICLLLGVLIPHVNEVKRAPVAGVVCEYSYSIYLSHCVAFWFALDFCQGISLVERGILLAVLSIAAPAVLYGLVERPGMALGRRLSGVKVHVAAGFAEQTDRGGRNWEALRGAGGAGGSSSSGKVGGGDWAANPGASI